MLGGRILNFLRWTFLKSRSDQSTPWAESECTLTFCEERGAGCVRTSQVLETEYNRKSLGVRVRCFMEC